MKQTSIKVGLLINNRKKIYTLIKTGVKALSVLISFLFELVILFRWGKTKG